MYKFIYQNFEVDRFYGLYVCLPYMSENSIIKNINLKLLRKSKLYKETMSQIKN